MTKNGKMKVVVGISGGVDSSVAAALLKKEGHDVVGLFMRNWNDTTGTLSGDCPWADDRVFAQLTAQKLGIEFHEVDLSEEYRARVVDYMFAEYERGRTPNPDVLCNREIKFDAFLNKALELGADKVATGHYCRVEEHDGKYELLAGVDGNKDQSYFLCQLNQAQLSRAMFPIGHLVKNEVRAIAAADGLATATRKDSQGICFVGKVDLPVFLQQKLKAKRGDIIEILPDAAVYQAEKSDFEPYIYTPQMGRKVGEHNGAHFYTIGQRRGLGVGGYVEPLFVIAIDVTLNVVYVGQGDSHPGLYRRGLFIKHDELHFLDGSSGAGGDYDVRIRYRQPLQKAHLDLRADGGYLTFAEPQRGVTPGQFAAWYRGAHLVGSGVIDR
ncbi:MAG: tRNA 2-thiouridine(34) synthase MnmA [Mucinivorans sp.]